MTTTRLEAFSDGVIAIIITIMVLEFKVPHGSDLAALRPLLPTVLTYLLSFVYLGIYWNNHHHLMHVTQRVSGHVLWANLHLLFWLSLVPFATQWMRESEIASMPVAVYGVVMLGAAMAWQIMLGGILRHRENDRLRELLGDRRKETISIVAYGSAVALAFVWPPLSIALYALVAMMWLIPDRRIESRIYRAPGAA